MRTPLDRDERLRRAFTLIELSIVVLIIGILLAFVLAAGAAGLETARVRATQALIAKLNAGLEERLDSVLATTVTPNGAHLFLAAIPPTNLGLSAAQINAIPWGIQGEQRAQVLARLDQVRAEFPDVFFIDPARGPGAASGLYPISFAGLPYPLTGTTPANYVLPLGNSVTPLFKPNSYNNSTTPPTPLYTGYGGFDTTDPANLTNPAGTGFNGASYTAAASLYKLIGYTPRGYDGVDNNGDGYVDDINEGTQDANGNYDLEAAQRIGLATPTPPDVKAFLPNHQHKTARAEMLYALLVEGIGPLGSVFSTEDFRETEVRDTDNDGVPEFVDGWGEPIQFFRWPVWHRTNQEAGPLNSLPLPGLQKGDAPYNPGESRQQNPLDANGQLVAVSWWGNNAGSNPMVPSTSSLIVQNYFGPMVDPLLNTGAGNGWDRSGLSARRAYFTKFLLVSSGPDRALGMPRLTDGQIRTSNALATAQAMLGSVSYGTAWSVAPGEGWAMLLDPTDPHAPSWRDKDNDPPPGTDYSLDDMTNQGLQNRGGGVQ